MEDPEEIDPRIIDRILKQKMILIFHATSCRFGLNCTVPDCLKFKNTINNSIRGDIQDTETFIVQQLIVHWITCDKNTCLFCKELKAIEK